MNNTLLNCLWQKKLHFDDCITEQNMSKFVDEINSIIKENEFFEIKSKFFTYIMNRIFSCEDSNFIKFFLNNNNLFGCYLLNEDKALYVVSLYFKLGFNEIMEGINVLCNIGMRSKMVGNTVYGYIGDSDNDNRYNSILTECIINLCDNKNIDQEEKRDIILKVFNSPLGWVKIDVEIFDIINEYFTYDELRELVKNTNNLFFIHYDKFCFEGKIFSSRDFQLSVYDDMEACILNGRVKCLCHGEVMKCDKVIEYLNKCEDSEKYMRKVYIPADEF